MDTVDVTVDVAAVHAIFGVGRAFVTVANDDVTLEAAADVDLYDKLAVCALVAAANGVAAVRAGDDSLDVETDDEAVRLTDADDGSPASRRRYPRRALESIPLTCCIFNTLVSILDCTLYPKAPLKS